MDESGRPRVALAQEAFHRQGHDYVKGSPHLRHISQRTLVESHLQALVGESFDRRGSCRVLEVGAGHGTFTDCLVAAGAEVLVTETSAFSAQFLEQKFRNNPRVEILYDARGDQITTLDRNFDLVACISLLHHIPDYLGFTSSLCQTIEPGGAFYSVQDPLWYPRVPRAVHLLHNAAYFAWRTTQGEFKRGLSTRLRRLRGQYDEEVPSDMVEYHVVRKGVDEEAMATMLKRRFEHVDVFRYWSTQAPLLNVLGVRAGFATNFGLIAHNFLG